MELKDVKFILDKSIKYPISMEIGGEMAMWSRSDSGSEKTTYPIPTFSAAKGVFESILYMPSVYVIPYKVQICNPLQYQKYAFNYRGAKRKSTLFTEKKDDACQIRTTVLYKPLYRLFAYVVNRGKDRIPVKYKGINQAHSYQEQFNRRLLKGRNYRTPCLGISEFLATYVGVFREQTKVQEYINYTLPSMVFTCFDSLNNGNYNPSYLQNVIIKKGEVRYVE